MQNATLGMCLLAMSAQAEARDVSCGEVKAAVAQMPDSKASTKRRAGSPTGPAAQSTSCAPRRAEPLT